MFTSEQSWVCSQWGGRGVEERECRGPREILSPTLRGQKVDTGYNVIPCHWLNLQYLLSPESKEPRHLRRIQSETCYLKRFFNRFKEKIDLLTYFTKLYANKVNLWAKKVTCWKKLNSEGGRIGHPQRGHFGMWIVLNWRQSRPSRLREDFHFPLAA